MLNWFFFFSFLLRFLNFKFLLQDFLFSFHNTSDGSKKIKLPSFLFCITGTPTQETAHIPRLLCTGHTHLHHHPHSSRALPPLEPPTVIDLPICYAFPCPQATVLDKQGGHQTTIIIPKPHLDRLKHILIVFVCLQNILPTYIWSIRWQLFCFSLGWVFVLDASTRKGSQKKKKTTARFSSFLFSFNRPIHAASA